MTVQRVRHYAIALAFWRYLATMLGMAAPNLRTTLPNPRQFLRFAGIPTFCRFPQIQSVPPQQQPIDWAIYGVPFDGGVTYRPGARFGPRAIRTESQYIKPIHLEHNVNLAEVFSLADAGDAPIKPFDSKENIDSVVEFAQSIGDPRHTRLLAVGGDHTTAYANIRATWQRRGAPKGGLALLHIDAHMDLVDVIAGSKWSHGSVFRRAAEDGLIDLRRMLSIGLRGPLNSTDDLDFARQRGVELITCSEAQTAGARQRITNFLKRLGDQEVYLTFDIDSIDPAYAPGTGTPTCGGLTSAQAFELLRQFAGVNLVGADVVEVLPDRDVTGITALVASHIIFEILALSAVRTRSRPPS
ncbi:MAG: agmatinase [Phycisphaerales bacterium]|nr:agmatinase [Phycisphaerales bacterium]